MKKRSFFPDAFRWHEAVVRVMQDAKTTGKPWSDLEVSILVLAWLYANPLKGCCWFKTGIWIYYEPAEVIRDPWWSDDMDEAVEEALHDINGECSNRWPSL